MALRLVEPSAITLLYLRRGKLAILRTPPDQCTQLEVHHSAPDGSLTINTLYLHMVNKFEAVIESCSPTQGNCQPNIEGLALKSTAGLIKTVLLYQ